MPIMSKSNLAYKKESLTDEEYLRFERQAFEKKRIYQRQNRRNGGRKRKP